MATVGRGVVIVGSSLAVVNHIRSSRPSDAKALLAVGHAGRRRRKRWVFFWFRSNICYNARLGGGWECSAVFPLKFPLRTGVLRLCGTGLGP